MKAALLERVKQLTVRDVETPAVSDTTALLRVKACGICGSDLKFYNYGDRVKQFPAILGHEIAGEVVEVGKNVSTLHTGDRIALGNEIPCKQCAACAAGLENVCENTLSIGTTLPGGLSEYMLLVPEMVERGPVNMVPQSIGYDEAALAEPLGCVVNGFEFAHMEEGKTVLIIGSGPIGCMMINIARILGASNIVVVEKVEQRLTMARSLGADEYLHTNGQFLDNVMALTNNRGYDVVMSATNALEAHDQAIRAVAKGGFVNLFGGVAKGLPDTVSFSSNFVHYRQFSIGGSFSQTKEHHKKALDYLAAGEINTKKLITHRFKLDDIQRAFDVVQSLEGLKVIVNP